MARPRKQNADYFSHDTNMRSNRKVIALRNKYWLEWYAVWCMLLEHIAWSDWFVAKRDTVEQEIVAWDFGVSVEFLWQIATYCGRLGMLQIQWWEIMSSSLNERLKPLTEKRERERARVSVAESPQSKVKESKVKETKVNNITTDIVSKDTTEQSSEKKQYWNPDINSVMDIIKKWIGRWSLDWTDKSNRYAARWLINKIKKEQWVSSWFMGWEKYLSMLVAANKDDKYMKWHLMSVKKISDKFTSLAMVADDTIKKMKEDQEDKEIFTPLFQ